MKKILTALVALMTLSVSANAMSYEQARREALFLTDKMAYELNLSDSQYDAAYEINLDYLMGVTSVDDVYGTYWTRRNLDISYILLDWQWNAFCTASYFYRPLYWSAGCWHFGIYARYPHRSYYYFHRPTVYVSYRGGHSWRANGGHSYYHSRRNHFHTPVHNAGMRDRWDRGEIGNRNHGRLENNRNDRYNNGNNRNDRYNNGNNRNDRYNNGNRDNGNRFDHNKALERHSSTRVTVNKRDDKGNTFNRYGNSFNRNGSPANRGGNSFNRNENPSSRSGSSFNRSGSHNGGGNRNGGSSFRQAGGSRQSQMKSM